MDVSIIMCSYNTRDITLEAVRSVYKETMDLDFELILIDNASIDGSADAIAEEFPQVNLIRSQENLGFARGNNLAAQQARGEYILLLNPDTILLNNAVAQVYKFAQSHPEFSICGGKTFYADLKINPTAAYNASSYWSLLSMALGFASFFRRSAVFNPESLSSWKWDQPREVDMVTGCFLLIKRDLWEKLGGFDECFFMYGEDADLNQRVRAMGGKCAVTTDAQLIHYGGASEKVRSEKMIRLFTAKAQLYSREGSPVTPWYGRAMLTFYAFNRMWMFGLAALFLKSKRESFVSWKNIWLARKKWSKKEISRSLQVQAV
jgi:N-acetylglucosaminyl-diphospho-decaprenol L-rhamnosyltransferase